MARIRIIEKQRKPSFTERLEEIAEALAERQSERDESSPVSTLERGLHLVLDNLRHWRIVHHSLNESLRREEFDLEQEIEHLDVTRRYQFPSYQRERLKKELRTLEKERRQLAVKHEERLQALHSELLALLNKRRYLRPENGH